MDKDLEAIRLHVAGATVRHQSPFDSLQELKTNEELSQEFIDKWVQPFYMNIGKTDDEWVKKLKAVKKEITPDIIRLCLGDFNWRMRRTGAFFSALCNNPESIDTIGVHLLKSQVCYAGATYAYVLAFFNTPRCVDYLNLYLEYYLTQPDLFFDQFQAMEAIKYLDNKNGTAHFKKHLPSWDKFISSKGGSWPEPITCERIDAWLDVIKKAT